MTQVTFATGEDPVTSGKLNLAVQGHRFIQRRAFVGLTDAQFYYSHPRATLFTARLIGPGGGGGGAAAGADGEMAVGGGGGGGGYAEILVESPFVIRSTMTIVAPGGGFGGPTGNNPGVAASSGAAILYMSREGFPVTLASAGAGTGGNWMPPGQSVFIATGGIGGVTFGGDITMRGEAGAVARRFSPTFGISRAVSGRGGNSVFRGSGKESVPPSDGHAASSFGGGGGGAAALGTVGRAGGRGGDALIVIDEYY